MSGDAKSRILARVRAGIGREAPASAAQANADREGGFAADSPPRPAWSDELLHRFLEQYAAAAGTYSRVGSTGGIVESILAYTRERHLERELYLAPHPLLDTLTWPADVRITRDGPVEDSLIAVSVADAGLAETGTLVLCSGPQAPTKLNFLPEFHIVLLDSGDVLEYMEDIWNRYRDRNDFPPRVVNFITGPSRTADVEQTIQLGAHGPRSLHLILLEGDRGKT